MSAENFRLTLERLRFPDYGNDDSKKNFRLLFRFFCVDGAGKAGTVLAALPALDQNNWQWRNDKKSNYLSHTIKDGTVEIDVHKIPTADRIILWDKLQISLLDLSIVDIEDKNVLDYTKTVLVELNKIGFETATGATGGVFLRLFKPLAGEAEKKVNQLLDKLTSDDNKVLFRAEEEAANGGNESNFIKSGTMLFDGAGVKGDYRVELKLAAIK